MPHFFVTQSSFFCGMCHNFSGHVPVCHNFLGHMPQLFRAYATTFQGMCDNFSWHMPQLFRAFATTFQSMCHHFLGHCSTILCGMCCVPQLFCFMARILVAYAPLFHVQQLFGACVTTFVVCALYFVAYRYALLSVLVGLPHLLWNVAYWSLPEHPYSNFYLFIKLSKV